MKKIKLLNVDTLRVLRNMTGVWGLFCRAYCNGNSWESTRVTLVKFSISEGYVALNGNLLYLDKDPSSSSGTGTLI